MTLLKTLRLRFYCFFITTQSHDAFFVMLKVRAVAWRSRISHCDKRGFGGPGGGGGSGESELPRGTSAMLLHCYGAVGDNCVLHYLMTQKDRFEDAVPV